MLGDPSTGIDDLRKDVVAEVLEAALDDPPGVSTIVGGEVLDVLEKHHGRLLRLDGSADREEQISLVRIIEAVEAAQRYFLGNTGKGERLAWEPCGENIVIRNPSRIEPREVILDDLFLINAVPASVGLRCEFVPLVGFDAFSADLGESAAESPDSSEKIDERERYGPFTVDDRLDSERQLVSPGSFGKENLLQGPTHELLAGSVAPQRIHPVPVLVRDISEGHVVGHGSTFRGDSLISDDITLSPRPEDVFRDELTRERKLETGWDDLSNSLYGVSTRGVQWYPAAGSCRGSAQ